MLSVEEIKSLKELTSKLSLKELKSLIKTSKEYFIIGRDSDKIFKNTNLVNLLKEVVDYYEGFFSVELMKRINSKLENTSNHNVSMLLFQCQSEIIADIISKR